MAWSFIIFRFHFLLILLFFFQSLRSVISVSRDQNSHTDPRAADNPPRSSAPLSYTQGVNYLDALCFFNSGSSLFFVFLFWGSWEVFWFVHPSRSCGDFRPVCRSSHAWVRHLRQSFESLVGMYLKRTPRLVGGA